MAEKVKMVFKTPAEEITMYLPPVIANAIAAQATTIASLQKQNDVMLKAIETQNKLLDRQGDEAESLRAWTVKMDKTLAVFADQKNWGRGLKELQYLRFWQPDTSVFGSDNDENAIINFTPWEYANRARYNA